MKSDCSRPMPSSILSVNSMIRKPEQNPVAFHIDFMRVHEEVNAATPLSNAQLIFKYKHGLGTLCCRMLSCMGSE